MMDLNALAARRKERRAFFKTLGTTALGLAGAGLLAQGADAQTGGLDAVVLNFALNLEYLEAEYYTFATTGKSITDLGVAINGAGTQGGVTIKASPMVPFKDKQIQQFAQEIAADERAHVTFLRTVLTSVGVTPVARPALDLLNSFNGAAAAAGIGPAFDPFADDISFLIGAFVFEDVGVTAYKGAAKLLANKTILENAAGILAVEAYHAGGIRAMLLAKPPPGKLDDVADIVQKISNLRDAADNSVTPNGVPLENDQGILGDDQPVSTPQGQVNITPTDSNAVAFSRTPRMVLNIVYLDTTGNAHSGGFFPAGLNGAVK